MATRYQNKKMLKNEYRLNFEDLGPHCIVSGETYDIKDHLKSMGAAWVQKNRYWFMPDMKQDDVIEKLQEILDQDSDDNDDEDREDYDDYPDNKDHTYNKRYNKKRENKKEDMDDNECNENITSRLNTISIHVPRKDKNTAVFSLVNREK